MTQSALPLAVVTSEVFEQIAANDDHTCAVRASDDAVFCWGSGAYGKLGSAIVCDEIVTVFPQTSALLRHVVYFAVIGIAFEKIFAPGDAIAFF